jgi:hypothetical protein
MYAIETPLGRFEADTEKAAKQLMRKAEKERQEKARQYDMNRELAQLRADAEAYHILKAHAHGQMPDSWRPQPITARSNGSVQPRWMDAGKDQEYAIETKHGRATKHYNGSVIYWSIENAGGYCVAIGFRNHDTGADYWYAVGVAGDQLTLADLPGLTLADFPAAPETITSTATAAA